MPHTRGARMGTIEGRWQAMAAAISPRSTFTAPAPFDNMAKLKAVMAKVVVAFHPLLAVNGDGRAEIDCAGQGTALVMFDVRPITYWG